MALQSPANTQDEDELMAHISQPKRTNFFSGNLLMSPPLLNKGKSCIPGLASRVLDQVPVLGASWSTASSYKTTNETW
jgi:hypothetical protein